jgi:hypothetical protein
MKMFLFVIITSMLSISAANATDVMFRASIRLFKPIAVSNIQDMSFTSNSALSSNQNALELKAGSGAAIFNIKSQGGSNRSMVSAVVESSVNMSAPGVKGTIPVSNFKLSAPTAFDASGNANNIKVDATAKVLASSEEANYEGTATLRVVYL